MIDDLELLRLIENNARLSSEEIAVMLGTTAADVDHQLGKAGTGQLHRNDRSKDHTRKEQGL